MFENECENVIEFLRDEKVAGVTFTQGRYISRVKELKERFPDEVEIITDKPNVLYAKIPTKWVKINPPPQREYTEEQKQAIAERLNANRI